MLTAPNLMLFSIFQPHPGWGDISILTQPLCSLSLNINSDWKPQGACSCPASIANSNDLSKHSLFATMIYWRQGRWGKPGCLPWPPDFKKSKTKPEQQKAALADTSDLWVLLGLLGREICMCTHQQPSLKDRPRQELEDAARSPSLSAHYKNQDLWVFS